MSSALARHTRATPPPLPVNDNQLAESIEELLWFGDADPERTQAQASASLAAAVAEATGLKPFPASAAQLMRILVNPAYKMREVEQVVRQDPAFATKLLRVANSPIFRRGNPVVSIEAAVVRMGSRQVLEIVAAVASMSMFENLNGYALEVHKHSIAVANIARTIGEWWGFHATSQLSLCGLLHDIGKLLSVQCNEINYSNMPQSALDGVDEVHVWERRLTGYDHAVLGGHVLTRWGIPDPVPQVVSWHHQQARAYEHGGDIGTMVAFLRLSDRIAAALRKDTALEAQDFSSLMADGSAALLEINSLDLRAMWKDLVAASAGSFEL